MLLSVLSGCVTDRSVSHLERPWQVDGSRPARTHSAARSPGGRWWQCLGDAQLSALNERGLATASVQSASPTPAQTRLSYQIAARYIALRAEQTALVLLGAREELDDRRAMSSATRADQARIQTGIAALREQLAVLTGLAPELLDDLPGGPIPLPPRGGGVKATPASARYAAAHAAAVEAQSQAEQSRAIAAQQDLRARAGTLPPATALAAEYRALDALQAEEQARAAMAQAYVALVGSLKPTEAHGVLGSCRGRPCKLCS